MDKSTVSSSQRETHTDVQDRDLDGEIFRDVDNELKNAREKIFHQISSFLSLHSLSTVYVPLLF